MSPPASRSARGRSRGGWTSRSRRPPSATSWPISRRRACSTLRTPRPAACRPTPACGSTSTACSRSATSPTRSSARSRASAPCAAAASRACCRTRRPRCRRCRATPASSPPRSTSGPFRHVEFVPLSPGRALVVVVGDNGMVENRVIDVPLGMSVATLVEAGNYLTARLAGRSFAEARGRILDEIEQHRTPARRADREGGLGRARDLERRPGATRRRLPDRPRPRQAARGRHQPRRPRADPRPVRDARRAPGHSAAGRADPVGQEHADLHRRGEPAVQPLGLRDDRGPLHRRGRGRPRRHRAGRHRRDRPDPHELRPDHPAGRLHRARGQPAAWAPPIRRRDDEREQTDRGGRGVRRAARTWRQRPTRRRRLRPRSIRS